MPQIAYETVKFSADRLQLVQHAVQIINDLRRQGYTLTLRQLYYQFVSRNLFPQSWADPRTGSINNERSYDRLGTLLSRARMGGLVDWNAIEDRTREVAGNNHWDGPAAIVRACSKQFMLDKWRTQPKRIEVWVEKDALEGIVARAARDMDVQYFSCRGYASQTSLWEAGQRLAEYVADGQEVVILHLGDHDPSGIDMTRDIRQRVSTFMGEHGEGLEVRRLALNMNQVRTFNPPPNPTKMSDCRAEDYVSQFGTSCWELDALQPAVIDQLIRDAILEYRDEDLFAELEEEEQQHRDDLARVADNWEAAVEGARN